MTGNNRLAKNHLMQNRLAALTLDLVADMGAVSAALTLLVV